MATTLQLVLPSGYTPTMKLWDYSTKAQVGTIGGYTLTANGSIATLYTASIGSVTGDLIVTTTSPTSTGYARVSSTTSTVNVEDSMALFDLADDIGGIAVPSVIGRVVDGANDTTLTAYVGETRTFTVLTLDDDDEAVDLSGLTLQVVIESETGTDIEVIANASITKTSTTIAFAPSSTTNQTVGVRYRWACRRTDTNVVLLKGVYRVEVAADD